MISQRPSSRTNRAAPPVVAQQEKKAKAKPAGGFAALAGFDEGDA